LTGEAKKVPGKGWRMGKIGRTGKTVKIERRAG
jgi:hypothetical protein